MRVIPPIEITDNILTSSSIIEPTVGIDPLEWSGANSYNIGDTVCLVSTHKIYEAINTIAAGGESPHLSMTRALPKWAEVGYTNKWSMFDLYRNTASMFEGINATIVLTPGIATDSIAILGVNNISSINITCTYYNGITDVVFFNETVDMAARPVLGWFAYFFEPITQKKALLFFNIPTDYSDMKITISIGGSEGMSVGACVLGNSTYLGSLQNGANVEALNFSRIERDVFGQLELVPRRSVPKISGEIVLNSKTLDEVQYTKRLLDALPAVWSGLDNQNTHPYFETLIILGIYKEFSFQISDQLYPRAFIEVEEI